jgi:triosephosphate isomerase
MSRHRQPIIAGNWKMNTTADQAVELADDRLDDLDAIEGVEIVLCPPFVSLVPLWEMLSETTVGLGAQNMYWEEKGAYTGEISPV